MSADWFPGVFPLRYEAGIFIDSLVENNTAVIKFPLTFYDFKRFLLYPRTLYMRHRERETSGFIKRALELHYYRRPFYDFIAAKLKHPGILHDHVLTRGSVVLDVGAFIGQWSQEVSSRYGARIYAFEPNPRSYQSLEVKMAEFPGLHAIPYGLGAATENTRISLRGLGSSTFENARVDAEASWEDVKIVGVEEAWQSLELETVDLMKINIEGAEFPLLEKMIENGLLARVNCFLIQFHEWHPGAHRRRRRIRAALAASHKLDWDYDFVWEKWSRI